MNVEASYILATHESRSKFELITSSRGNKYIVKVKHQLIKEKNIKDKII